MNNKAQILHPDFLNRTIDFLEPVEAITMPVGGTAAAAVESLKEHHLGSIFIVDEENKVQGIFTERDLITKLALSDKDLNSTSITEAIILLNKDGRNFNEK